MYSLSLLLLALPTLAFAAPTGWKPADQCNVPPDHGLYTDDLKLIGCITDEAWAAALNVSLEDQNQLRAFIFPSGTTKVGSDGVRYICLWFFGFIDCARALPE
jgi:hypothetical protein